MISLCTAATLLVMFSQSIPEPVSASDIDAMNHAAAAMTLPERLHLARAGIGGRLVFTTSFGLEDQVLADALFSAAIDVAVVTLDTGRMFPETYDLWAETERRYGQTIPAFLPDGGETSRLVAGIGINGFYDSQANRHACCGVRKVEPLGRALAGAAGWLTGLRADQSAERGSVAFTSFDAARQVIKVNPLFDWTRDRLQARAEQLEIPLNRLHARGFLSIGCAPCTRAVRPGEPERAGRWWWEADTIRECGLHVGADGRLQRTQREPA